jgi:hypothetical protein
LAPVLQPIQVFMVDRHIEGWIVAVEERITDLLNRRDVLRICTDAASDTWETIESDQVLIVAPPVRATNPQRRIHRQKHRLMALVGPYVVTGIAHLQPGTALDPYLLRTRQHFLPMTSVSLTHRIDPSFEQELPVVIINVANLDELRGLLTVA